MKEEGKSEHSKLNSSMLLVLASTFSHLTIISPDFFPFLSCSYFLIPLSGAPKIYPNVDSAVPTNLGGFASWKTSNFNFCLTEITSTFTFEEVFYRDCLSVIRIEVIPVYFSFENSLFRFVNFLKFNNQKRVSHSDKVQIS